MTEILLAYSWADFYKGVRGNEPVAWLLFGFCGNIAFFTRFLVQWIYSERAKESKVPEIFWWQSIVGTVILLIYFIHRNDPVGILGYVVNIVPYTRNLVLVYRKKGHGARGLDAAPPPH